MKIRSVDNEGQISSCDQKGYSMITISRYNSRGYGVIRARSKGLLFIYLCTLLYRLLSLCNSRRYVTIKNIY